MHKDYYGISLSFFDTDSPTLKIQQKIIQSKSQSSFPNIQHAK